MTRTRDGLTQTVQATDAQVTYYTAQGYSIFDPTLPPVRPTAIVVRHITYADGYLLVDYTDGTTDTIGPLPSGGGAAVTPPGPGTTQGTIVVDSDGVPYSTGTAGGVGGIALDIDGVPYLSPTGTIRYAYDTDGVPYIIAA